MNTNLIQNPHYGLHNDAQYLLGRAFFSLPLALLFTVSIIWLMHTLIDEDYVFIPPKHAVPISPFMPPDPKIEVLPETPDKPLPPEPMPASPVQQDFQPDLADNSVAIGPAPVLKDSGPGILAGLQEGEPIPYLRVAPLYPSRAITRGTEGFVDLRFAITATGATDGITVIQSNPQGTFDRAAIRAVKKWKYKPQIKNGVATRKENVTTRVSFRVADS